MKKYLFAGLIMLCVLTVVFLAGFGFGKGSVVKGDVNGDGEVTITDYTLIRLHILGIKELEE